MANSKTHPFFSDAPIPAYASKRSNVYLFVPDSFRQEMSVSPYNLSEGESTRYCLMGPEGACIEK